MEVERVVSSASEGTSNLKGGRDDLRKIREILVDITNYTSEVAEKATLILGLTHRQKEKVEKSVEIIEQVANIARENLSSTEKVESAVERHGAAIGETMAASEKLSELSRDLKAVVAKGRRGLPKVDAPAFTQFVIPIGPLWPILFVTIACGAISGWHSLVSTSGTARQLERETDALPVGEATIRPSARRLATNSSPMSTRNSTMLAVAPRLTTTSFIDSPSKIFSPSRSRR